MDEKCGTCKFNTCDRSNLDTEGYLDFVCGNEESDNYGVSTFYDDSCDCWEGKEDA